MITCPQCSTVNADNTKFCTNCGFNFANMQTQPNYYQNYQQPNYTQNYQQQNYQQSNYNQNYNQGYQQPNYGTNPPYYMGSTLIYPKANLGNRLLAAIIDNLIFLFLLGPMFLFFAISDSLFYDSRSVYFYLITTYGLLPTVYLYIKDGLFKGQSIGKKAMGLMVVSLDDNKPCTVGKSAIRTFISSVLYFIPYLNIVTALIEPIMVLATKDGRKVADLVANTQVINVKDYNGM